MYKLVSFLISCTLISAGNAADHIISSERITDWGVWGSMARCPQGSFVVSWMQKVEEDQGFFYDDTAQNAIRMNCATTSDPGTITSMITSTVGPFGNWGSTSTCYPSFVTGFNLRVESYQGDAPDDTATNNFRARCGNGQIVDGAGMTWGSWRTEKNCDYRHAVCGLQTQVEPDQGSGDDTALNNVSLLCCQLPNYAETCVPKQKYIKATVCDNTNSKSDTECTVSFTIGVGYVSGKEEIGKSWAGAGFTLEDAMKDLPKTLKSHLKQQEMATTFSESVFTETKDVSVTVTVPAGVTSKFSYLAAECEYYSVASRKIQRVDVSKDGKVETTSYFYI